MRFRLLEVYWHFGRTFCLNQQDKWASCTFKGCRCPFAAASCTNWWGGCGFTAVSCNCHFVCGGPWGEWYPDVFVWCLCQWYPDVFVWCLCHLTSLTGEGEGLPGVAELRTFSLLCRWEEAMFFPLIWSFTMHLVIHWATNPCPNWYLSYFQFLSPPIQERIHAYHIPLCTNSGVLRYVSSFM